MRSRTGCQTCRSRKLKCDEQKPVCGQCQKGSRECHPSDGVVFRHQQNASMNGAKELSSNTGEKGGRLGGFYAYKNTFDENNIWVDVPKNVTFYHITDPYKMDSSPEPESIPASTPAAAPQADENSVDSYFRTSPTGYDNTSGLETLSAAATSSFDYMRPLSVPVQTPDVSSSIYSPPPSNNIQFILNPTAPDLVDPVLSSPSVTQSATHSSITTASPVNDHETAFLLRHFGETTGQWMDLFDLGCYFAQQVPVQALSNPLLKHSACAYAAKQLGRVRGRKAVIGGIVRQQAQMELFPCPETVDWEWIGAKYYDKAISLLMEHLSNSGNPEIPFTPTAEDVFVSTPQSNATSPQSAPSVQPNKKRRLSRPAHTSNADETLAAAAILCVYEFLDNANIAWSRHLSGTKSLFDMADSESMMPVQSPTSPGAIRQRISPSRARKATFWNFARQDFLAAFINEGQTRLNTADLSLWRAAGLQLDEDGFILPSNTEDGQYPERQLVMREDMISNALIWLLSKIINYIASGDSLDHVFPQDRSSPLGNLGIAHMVLLERWKELEHELDVWYRGLPDTFKPCVRLPPVTDGSIPADSPRTLFSEIWYSIPMCASTMQSYHMARIILLLNKPHESTARRTTLASRLHSYQTIGTEVRNHSYEICGIALGRPEGSVRIHQVQPLFVSGSCLTETRERRVILDLLRAVEKDLGWATDYRVKSLLKAWGWDENQA